MPAGSPVGLAGLRRWTFVDVDLTEVDGVCSAFRVRVSWPYQNCAATSPSMPRSRFQSTRDRPEARINIVSRADRPWLWSLDKFIQGGDDFFDRFMEQVGSGLSRRSHLSHTIASVREPVRSGGPRVRETLAAVCSKTRVRIPRFRSNRPSAFEADPAHHH